MPIKDRWNRMLRKSVSSNSSGTGTDDRTNSTSEGESLTKPTSRLAKTLTWRSGRSSKTPHKKEKQPAPALAAPHPGERPLTETNMRHQELLNAFSMNFGRRKASAGGRTSYSGISPGNSRQASVDTGYIPAARHPDRRMSSLAGQVPREEAEGA